MVIRKVTTSSRILFLKFSLNVSYESIWGFIHMLVQRPEEGIMSSRAGVMIICKQPVDAGNQAGSFARTSSGCFNH